LPVRLEVKEYINEEINSFSFVSYTVKKECALLKGFSARVIHEEQFPQIKSNQIVYFSSNHMIHVSYYR
jgi:hypothetical protein